MENNHELTLFEQQMQSVVPTADWFKKADEFQKLFSRKPAAAAIKKNKFANDSEYVEIGYIEMKLDQITKGLWNTEVKDVKLIGNSICVTIRLSVFHLSYKTWIHRDGVGACPIEVRKDASPVDFSQITAKAISKNLPVAKTEALKNAAKSLGNIFGRHLNRQFQHEYAPEAALEQFVNP